MGGATSAQDTTSCCGALLGLQMQAKVMLPAATYRQRGVKCTLGHRSARDGSALVKLYEVHEDTLGKGSYGVVRKTVSKKTGNPCVMKTVAKQGLDSDILAYLANEIAIQEMCDHPNVARLYETFETPEEIHIAMECCDGGDLLEYTIAQGGTLSEPDTRILMQELLQAVFYLHSVQFVAHRDIKPENILLKYPNAPMKDQVVKLIDFGFAQSFEPGTRSLYEACGTPIYMAPEILDGLYSERCDVWSCGVVLYELLSGCVPFNCSSASKLLRMAAMRPTRTNGPEWDGISFPAKGLLQDMLKKRAGDRLSAGEALQHEWFKRPMSPEIRPVTQEEVEGSTRGSGKLVQNLRDFSSLSDFQKAALRLAAYRLDDGLVQEHRSCFRALDANGDGRLSLQELSDGCPELGLSAEEATELFHGLDVDGSGTIEYTEFLGAAVCRDTLPQHACWEAFRVCDKDGSGVIQLCEVEEVVERFCGRERSHSKDSSWSSTCPSTPAGGPMRRNASLSISTDFEEMDFDHFVDFLRSPSKAGRPPSCAE